MYFSINYNNRKHLTSKSINDEIRNNATQDMAALSPIFKSLNNKVNIFFLSCKKQPSLIWTNKRLTVAKAIEISVNDNKLPIYNCYYNRLTVPHDFVILPCSQQIYQSTCDIK